MKGVIERIKVYPAKGEAGREAAEASFIENFGLEGDHHAKGGERQISILVEEAGQGEKGLCHSRFKENLAVRGLAPSALRPGIRLEAGEAEQRVVLEITGETKHCHERCSLREAGKSCSLAGLNLFAKVLKSGVIRVGDGVSVSC